MGFYGNITNVANTTFQFDKIYSNRVEMESHCNSDGIMVGRYVLVEYDNDAAYPVIYTNNGKFYSSPGYEEATRIKFLDNTDKHDGFHLNEIGQVQVNTSNDQGIIISTSIEFYRCTGQDGDYAVFVKIDEPNTSNYIANFSIDEAQYSNGKSFRGYDSTVWVKTSDNNGNSITTHYVNIADLNSVVPTFGIAADAPTMSPITPHFDADSTNVYYKLHIQPTYGLRVGKGSDSSDGETYWTRENYNSATGSSTNEYWDAVQNKWVTYTDEKQIQKFAGDIYFNKDAFDWEPDKNGIIHKTVKGDDVISILPTGESGNTYYDHNSKTNKTAKDIQEIKVSLPSIGNMMSDAWDIIHGPNRDNARTDENSSLQGRLNSIDDLERNQIPIKRTSDGTIVGTKINGDNQKTVEENQILLENLSTIENEFEEDDAWIRTVIDTKDENGDQCIAIHHTYHPDSTNYDVASNLNSDKVESINGEIDTIQLYTPKIDNAGHVVGKSINTVTLPYGYKTIKTNGREDDEDKQTENASSSPITDDVIADNTQDELTINSGNKWIRIDTDKTNDSLTISHDIHNFATTANDEIDLNEDIMSQLGSIDFAAAGVEELLKYRDMKILGVDSNTIVIPDWDYDRAGHITDKHERKYTLPFGFKTITVNNNSNADIPATDVSKNVVADNTQDILTISASNDWVRFSTDTNADEIKVGHKLSSLGKGTYASTDTAISEFGDSFNVVNFTTDEAGHVVGASTTTITTPVGHYNIDTTTNNTTVLTGFEYTPTKGDIKTYSEKIDTLKFTDFSAASGKLAIDKNSTLVNAFKTVQEYINGLDQTTSGTTTFISGITQIDGQLAFTRSEAGTLQIGTDSNDGTVKADSSIIGAINLLEARIKEEENTRANAINTLYGEGDIAETFNTIKEIADWLDGAEEGSSVEQLVASINNNATKISDEITRATNAETAIKNTINGLTVADTAVTNQYVSAVSQSGGKITVTRGTIATGTANGTIAVNGSNVSVKGLGSAAYTESTDYVQKSAYEAKIAELEAANENLQAAIEKLKKKIEALEPTTE